MSSDGADGVPAAPAPLEAATAGAGAGTDAPCCVPRIHPTSTPKHVKEMAATIVSRLTGTPRFLTRSYRVQDFEIVPDGPVESHPQRVADECVADGHLIQVRERAEQGQVVEIEIMTGVDVHAQIVGQAR